MTRPPHDADDRPSRSFAEDPNAQDAGETLSPELNTALGKLGMLLPETLDEVRRAELEHDANDAPLPRALQHFRARDNVVQFAPRPAPAPRTGYARAWLGATVAFALGAAAASVLWSRAARDHESQQLPIGGADAELRESKTPPTEPVRLRVNGCSECCAGSQCGQAKEELKQCPSGRACVNCSAGDGPNSYKLRVSALALSDAGKAWAQSQKVQLDKLQLCATIQGRAVGCRSAVETPVDLVEWVSLPVATTAAQLVGGLSIALLAPDSSTLANWSSSVSVSPELLCRGVAARLAPESGEPLGRVSLFFDDGQFVELGRAATVADLLGRQRGIVFEGGALDIYETSGAGAQRFALVLGPTDRARAEAVRWQLLEQKLEGKLTFGEDHRGRPRPQ
jgi:hypothetical protein